MQHKPHQPQKHQNRATPSRRQRLELVDEVTFEDETSHLWAVSYADFLMVLLSFFVIFFSVDQESKEDITNQIIELTKVKEAFIEDGASSQGKGRGPGSVPSLSNKKAAKAMVASIRTRFEEIDDMIQIVESTNPRQITIYLPDDIFERNTVVLNRAGRKSLKRVLDVLTPHSSAIDITIIGHSDSTKVRPRIKPLIKNNFSLSALRASEALTTAVRQGFSPEHLKIRGDAEAIRDSRTISLLIKAREDL